MATLKRFDEARRRDDNAVIKVVISEKNAQLIWAATAKSGVYRSDDGGRNWRGFTEEFAEIHTKDADEIFAIALGQSDGKTVVVATGAGLIRSLDNGGHWQSLDLIPPSDKIVINDIAVFAGNPERIYYTTNTSFGWTDDGGKTWSSKKLPSSRRGSALAVDWKNPLVVYLGLQAPPQ